MKASSGKKQKRHFSDINFSEPSLLKRWLDWLGSKGNLLLLGLFKNGSRVVNLKPAFYKRYPFIFVLVVALIIVVGFAIRSVLTLAEVADFYPATCLGTWQNAQNAQGKPEVLKTPNVSSTFNDKNSAIYNSTSSQIFCGGFVPRDYNAKGNIKNIGLTLVWQVYLGNVSSTGQASSTAILSTSTSSTSTPALIGPTSTGTVPAKAKEMPAATSTPKIKTSLFRNFEAVFFNFALAESSSTTTATSSLPSRVSNASSAGQAAPANQTTTIPLSQRLSSTTTTPPAPPPPTSATSTNTTTTKLAVPQASSVISVTTSTVLAPTSTSSTTIVISPPITATLAPLSTSTSSSSVTKVSSSTTSSTAAAPTVLPPPTPDANFLKVSYSTDGQTWGEITKVNPKNWQNLTISLPLKTWDELKKLQISVEGIPTVLNPLPKVYLDGMFVEVHYELPSVASINNRSIEQQSPAGDAHKDVKIFDPHARHTCSVEPFTQKARAGEIVKYQIKLTPSYENAPFELKIGSLPHGISAQFDQLVGQGVTQSFMSFSIPGGARKGSFNIVAIYEEREKDNTVLSNFCQLNLIVE